MKQRSLSHTSDPPPGSDSILWVLEWDQPAGGAIPMILHAFM
jgi:hypothetical protein